MKIILDHYHIMNRNIWPKRNWRRYQSIDAQNQMLSLSGSRPLTRNLEECLMSDCLPHYWKQSGGSSRTNLHPLGTPWSGKSVVRKTWLAERGQLCTILMTLIRSDSGQAVSRAVYGSLMISLHPRLSGTRLTICGQTWLSLPWHMILWIITFFTLGQGRSTPEPVGDLAYGKLKMVGTHGTTWVGQRTFIMLMTWSFELRMVWAFCMLRLVWNIMREPGTMVRTVSIGRWIRAAPLHRSCRR